LLFLAGTTLILGSQCSDTILTQSGGGGSETINAKIIISDTVARFEPDIKQSDFFAIHVFDGRYKPFEGIGYADSLSGDSASLLFWHAPYAGRFNFYLSHESGYAAFAPDIKLLQGMRDTIHCSLKKRLTVKGKISSQDPVSAHVLYIQGSPFFCISDSVGHFSMPSLPSGGYVLKTRPVKGRLFMVTNDYLVNTDSLGEKVSVVLEEK